MTGWARHLEHVQDLLDHAARQLAAGDVDGAADTLDRLPGSGPTEDIPTALHAAARRTLAQLEAVEAMTLDALHRLGPELAVLVAASVAPPPAAVFLDQSA